MTQPTPSAWIGTAYRHIRAGAGRDVLDFRYAGAFAGNRWNEQGEPTLYLAGDPGVLVAEWGRQLHRSLSAEVIGKTVEREVYRLYLRLDRVLDLRDRETAAKLDILDGPHRFVDRGLARATATRVRAAGAQAMLVPSIAFLDEPSRWNLVVFLEAVPDDTNIWIQRVETIGPLRWN